MVCPYAGQQRGTIVYCELVGRRVSSLRYPCKGNYRVCPLYRARAPETRVARPEEREEAPRPVHGAPGEAAAAAAQQPGEAVVEAIRPVGEALRDTFVEAQLILRSEPAGRVRARFEELPRVLRSRVGDGPAFVSGVAGGQRFRCLYANGVVFSIVVEAGGGVRTGREAVEELAGREVDARVYRFVFEKLSEAVADAIRRDMAAALGG